MESQKENGQKKKLYEGITLLDFSTVVAGPFVASYFADFGANVIKIELPTGDPSRGYAPIFDGSGMVYWIMNRGKKSITIDLTDPRGLEIAKKLVAEADIILENNRPGIFKKFGLDYESVKSVNPSVIYCSLTAFGQTGVRANKGGYDMLMQALSGLMDYNGQPDGPPNAFSFVIGDYFTYLYCAIGIASALYYRSETGIGQWIDVAVLDSLVSINNNVEYYSATGKMFRRNGNHQNQNAPYGVYFGKNEQSIVIAVANEKLWKGVLRAMGDAAGPLAGDGYQSARDRVANYPTVIETIESWLKTFDNIDDAVALLDKEDVPVGKIRNGAEVAMDEALWERGTIVDFETPSDVHALEKIKGRGVVIHMSETPGKIGKPPALGEHQLEVLEPLGYDRDYILALQQEWKEKFAKK